MADSRNKRRVHPRDGAANNLRVYRERLNGSVPVQLDVLSLPPKHVQQPICYLFDVVSEWRTVVSITKTELTLRTNTEKAVSDGGTTLLERPNNPI